MQKLFTILGNFFKGFSLFLTIIHHIIWIIIGGAILIGVFMVLKDGGVNKIIQQNLPAQLQKGDNQSSSNNNNQNSSNQQSNNLNGNMPSQQEMQCAANIIGQAAVNQIVSTRTVSYLVEQRIKGCFPNGAPFNVNQ